MNIAVIFAGGVGKRMKTNGIPKQFLKIDETPIIIHTLNVFNNTKKIDAIVIACVSTHIKYLKNLVEDYNIFKVKSIVAGGKTGQESIINALEEAKKISKSDKDIVLIHDGVRPIIDSQLIINNIECVKKYGTSQSFYLNDIVEAEENSLKNGDIDCIDSCSVMKKYGKYKNPHIVLCNNDNLKVTTPEDYYIAEALIKQRKNKEVWGL